DEERESAIVDAFIKVQAYFPQAEPQIVKRSAPPPPSPKAEQLSPFEQQLRKAPLQNHFEKEILARILVEMAGVDGDIEAEEREMLEDVITPDLGTIPGLMQKDPVSPMECREISAGSKETIYMAAWMMALANMDISPAEENLLQEYADMFALSSQVATRIVRDARFSALENAIDDPSISRSALFELADQLNMNHEDAELCLIQIKKNM
ncbi:MAG: TerB family tellurite resistance protein, partial [Saprospiraceae bacterium]|nr:TerB family tellurite resistance protein [Saprospiraceae bacterium]